MTLLSPIGRVFRTQVLRKKRLEMVSKYTSGAILDVGCGPADIVHFLYGERHFHSEGRAQYIGIDVSRELVEDLKKKYPSLTFFSLDVDNEDLPPHVSRSRFDTILLVAVIEHLKNPEKVLMKASNLLRDNGRLIITTATPIGERIHNVLAVIGLTSKEAVKEHKRAARAAYSFQNLTDLFGPSGLEIEFYQRFEFGLNQMVVLRKRGD